MVMRRWKAKAIDLRQGYLTSVGSKQGGVLQDADAAQQRVEQRLLRRGYRGS